MYSLYAGLETEERYILATMYGITSLVPFYAYLKKDIIMMKWYLIAFQVSSVSRTVIMILAKNEGLIQRLVAFQVFVHLAFYGFGIFVIIMQKNEAKSWKDYIDFIAMGIYILISGILGAFILINFNLELKYFVYTPSIFIIAYSSKIIAYGDLNLALKLIGTLTIACSYMGIVLMFICTEIFFLISQEFFLYTTLCYIHIITASYKSSNSEEEVILEQPNNPKEEA